MGDSSWVHSDGLAIRAVAYFRSIYLAVATVALIVVLWLTGTEPAPWMLVAALGAMLLLAVSADRWKWRARYWHHIADEHCAPRPAMIVKLDGQRPDR